MALTVGELYVQLDLDSSKFTKALDDAKKLLEDIINKPLKVNLEVNVDSSKIDDVKSDLSEVQSQAGSTQTSFTNLGNELNRVFLTFDISNVIGMLEQAKDAIGSFIAPAADFEHAISQVAATAGGLSENQLEQIRVKALEIGAATSLSSSQAAEAFEALVANGIKVDDKFNDIADATVALAEATGANLTTAANVATDVIANFKEEGQDLNAVINGITGVTVAGKFGIEDYAQALANGGIAAGGMGVSLKDFNTVMAATSSSFDSGASAGTAFRNFINLLTPQSAKAKDAMKELGLITKDGTNAFYTSEGALRSQAEVFELLQNAFAGLTEAQRSSYAETIFGVQGLTFLNAAIVQGGEGLEKYAKDIEGISAADIAATRLNNFEGAMSALQGSIEAFSITAGSLLLSALTDIVKGLSAVIGEATNVVSAIAGSQEAFATLSPAAQIVVIAIQDILDAFESLTSGLDSVFNATMGQIQNFFSDITGNAFGWGANVGGSFADGISGSINAIIDAISGIGDALSYWLQPGSPPKVAPDIDKWAQETGQLYADELFSEVDFKQVKTFTDNLKKVLDSAVASGSMSESDALSGLIGGKDAFKDAVEEMKVYGRISQSTFKSIIAAAGTADQSLIDLINSTIDLENANQQLAYAQQEVTNAKIGLDAINDAYDEATRAIREQLDLLERQDKLADLDAQIKEQQKLANAVGGTGEIQAEAQRELAKLILEKQLLEKEAEFQPQIDAAESQVDRAQEALDVAKANQEQAKAQYDLVVIQIEAQKENNELLKQQLDLQKKLADEAAKAAEEETKTSKGGGGGGGSRAPEIDKDKEAQDRYNFSLLDTAGKLQSLRDKLNGVKEGSAEYYQILGQINSLEETQRKEQEKAAKDAQKELEETAKAQRDYEFSIADSAGKLKILRGELANVEVGSKDYYDILKQIDQLETQESKKGGKGGKGGGGGGGLDVVDPDVLAEQEKQRAKEAAEKQRAIFEQQKQDAELKKQAQEKAMADQAEARARMNAILEPFKQLGAQISAYVSYAFNNIMYIIQPALSQFQMFVQNGLTILSEVWATHGEQIMTSLSTAWNSIVTIVTGVFTILVELGTAWLTSMNTIFIEHKEEIITAIGALWNIVMGIINGALGIIQGIITIALGAIRGDWDTVWNGIKMIIESIFNTIVTVVGNFFTFVLSIFGVNTAKLYDDVETWTANMLGSIIRWTTNTLTAFTTWFGETYTKFTTWISDTFTAFSTWIGEMWNKLSTWITDTKTSWDNFWAAVKLTIDTITAGMLLVLASWILDLIAKFVDVVEGIKTEWEKLSTLPTDITTWIGEALSAITSQAQAFYNGAISLGTSVIDGIKQGISNGIESIKEKAKEIARAAISAATGVLDSHSPSKVFIDIGRSIPQGFVKGMEDGNVFSSVGNMINSTIPSMQRLNPAMQMPGNSISISIDARGSTMSEQEFKKIIRDELKPNLDKVGKQAEMRRKF